jgi:hypothetical protein
MVTATPEPKEKPSSGDGRRAKRAATKATSRP